MRSFITNRAFYSFSPKNIIKVLVLVLLVRPFVWLFLGLNRYSRLKLPTTGPVIIAANHNSHLDTLLIFALLPLSVAIRTSCVAAGDYFYGVPILSWLLFDLFDMIPVWRNKTRNRSQINVFPLPDPLSLIFDALEQGRSIIIFPEGTRGLPEVRSNLKKGIAKLAISYPHVPIFPVHIRGLGKSLPRGEKIFVPLIPQIAVGGPLLFVNKMENQIMEELAQHFFILESSLSKKDWVNV